MLLRKSNLMNQQKSNLNKMDNSELIDKIIESLGEPCRNEYILKPDETGTWWIYHRHLGSGEPVRDWLEGIVNKISKNP